MSEEIIEVYELELKNEPVKMKNADGVVLGYSLNELSGKERDKYLNTIAARTKTLPNGKSTVHNFEGMQADLLLRSMLRTTNEEGETLAVSVKLKKEEIQAWPARVQSSLFKRAQKLSGLNEEEKKEGEEGNE